jgi:hypothetical protein
LKRDVVYGQDCDDTEYRNEWGSPNWKNRGQWLSECDSIRTVNLDREFAERTKQKKREQARQDSIDLAEVNAMDFDVEFDMEVMWEQAQWEEIQDVTTEVYETEYITAVAGVLEKDKEEEDKSISAYGHLKRKIQE